jgi:LysR family transcriptional regulator, cys regulon transcriptional activator
MNFQQLRIMREAVRCKFNLTEVAHVLAASQSGVSKHIKDLEDELGLPLFIRHGKRLLGLTEAGEEIVTYARRILVDTANIRRIAEEMGKAESGELTIATTHTQARYALPPVIAAFRKAYPAVHLLLHQASPVEIADMLLEGRADIGIATEALSTHAALATFPYYSWHHSVIVPRGHDLERYAQEGQTTLSLAKLAQHPIVTYHEGFTGRPMIDRAFAEAGLKPDIVMAALDADVIKAYVELGMGVGIIAAMAFDPARDLALTLLPAEALFEQSTSHIALRRGRYLRGFAYRFIEMCRPALTQKIIRAGLDAE